MAQFIEEWRSIPSLPEYEASSLGRVRRREWSAPLPHGGRRKYGGKAWPGSWDGRRFVIRFRGKTYRVAPLVCEAWNGPSAPGQVCMHQDESARNNVPSNLAWGTQRENLNAAGFLAACRARGLEHSRHMNSIRWGTK